MTEPTEQQLRELCEKPEWWNFAEKDLIARYALSRLNEASIQSSGEGK